MAFEVYVFYVPRARSAHVGATGRAVGDDTLVISAPDTAVWKQPPSFQPWAITVQFTGALPEGDAPASTDIETPPSWQYRPFPRAWSPRQAWTPPPQNDSLAVVDEAFAERIIGRSGFRQPYDPRRTRVFLQNHPLFDESLTFETLADAPGSIPRNLYQDAYTAWSYIGSPAADDSWDLDFTTRSVGRPPFKNPYNPMRALDHLFNVSFDDSLAVAAQPDQQATVVRNPFRRAYRPERALVMFSGTPAYDESVTLAPQEGLEAQGTIVRNTFSTRYQPMGAIVKLSGIESHDDSTAPTELTGGVYIPTLRRRRR